MNIQELFWCILFHCFLCVTIVQRFSLLTSDVVYCHFYIIKIRQKMIRFIFLIFQFIFQHRNNFCQLAVGCFLIYNKQFWEFIQFYATIKNTELFCAQFLSSQLFSLKQHFEILIRIHSLCVCYQLLLLDLLQNNHGKFFLIISFIKLFPD